MAALISCVTLSQVYAQECKSVKEDEIKIAREYGFHKYGELNHKIAAQFLEVLKLTIPEIEIPDNLKEASGATIYEATNNPWMLVSFYKDDCQLSTLRIHSDKFILILRKLAYNG